MTAPKWLGGWTKFGRWVAVDPRLSDGEARTLLYVAGRIFRGSFALSVREIARHRQIAGSTAREHLYRLVALGYLTRDPKGDQPSGRAYRYAKGPALEAPPDAVRERFDPAGQSATHPSDESATHPADRSATPPPGNRLPPCRPVGDGVAGQSATSGREKRTQGGGHREESRAGARAGPARSSARRKPMGTPSDFDEVCLRAEGGEQ